MISGYIENILHTVKTLLSLLYPAAGAHRAMGKSHATGSLVGYLYTLSFGGKQYRVFTDDITRTDGFESNGFTIPGTDLALATVDGTIIQVAAQGFSDYLAHF